MAYTNETKSAWPPARVREVEAFAARGWTAAAIAEELDTTRNSIIGLCRRKSIPLISKNGGYKPPKPKAPVAKKMKKPKKRLLPAPPPVKLSLVIDNPTPSAPQAGQRLARLTELAPNGCKHPEHRGADGEWLMCGRVRRKEAQYCEHHYWLCYPVREKKAARR